jgi:hypothetical protein
VDKRFAELLEKGRAGQLSPEESEELARLLNAPILDPVINPPAGFVSRHTFGPSDVAERVRAIDWFSHCGEPLDLDLTMEVEQVRSWSKAMKACASQTWENAELGAQNQLTLWLHNNDRENYQEWNKLVEQFKAEVVNPLTEEKWVPFQQKHGLGITLVHSVQWNILSALMENAYLGSGHRCFFFRELLWVYEAGHFPCGWRGEWPQGKLVIF